MKGSGISFSLVTFYEPTKSSDARFGGGWGWGWGRGWAVLINFFVLSFLFYLFVYLFVLLKAFDENLVVYVSKTIPYLGSFVHIYNVNISDTFERYVQSYIRIYFPTMV